MVHLLHGITSYSSSWDLGHSFDWMFFGSCLLLHFLHASPAALFHLRDRLEELMNESRARTKPLCLVLYSEVAEHFAISFLTCSELCPPFLNLFDESLSDLSEFPFT